MKHTFDLSQQEWRLSCWVPYAWRFGQSMETNAKILPEFPPIPTSVPGSVQAALRDAGRLPDWNVGLNAAACEWIENRHWLYDVPLADDWVSDGQQVYLRGFGLDYSGWVLVNGQEVGTFVGTFTPHMFDLTPFLQDGGNRLALVFDCPPRWLGMFGYTSQMTAWKPRFNYTWDWTARVVQIGIWDDIVLEVGAGDAFDPPHCRTNAQDGHGTLFLQGHIRGEQAQSVRLTLEQAGQVVREEQVSIAEYTAGLQWNDLPVALWYPSGRGAQPLYTLRGELSGNSGEVEDAFERRVGFKTVEWRPCEGAPPEADPWICVVNGQPLFLQGVNWTPIRPTFADVAEEDYRQRLVLYRDVGCNLMRVWGGAFLEKQIFYDLCDELGLLVWQEFPLSSSGLENWPPEDETSIGQMEDIARSYIARRRHHASLLLWCGGNELQGDLAGNKSGVGKPIDSTHPMMVRLGAVVAEQDPGRRFLPTSASGPYFTAGEENFGQGKHWDVHGPWQPEGALDKDWTRYWAQDDALFRSETGSPGASPADIIRAHLGDCAEVPGTADNPFWRRTSWWIEWPVFVEEMGREPTDLEDYVAWSQTRQAQALAIAVHTCKARFPRCGGILLWMGHDSFPCAANTSILDFWGRPKPAAYAVAKTFCASDLANRLDAS